MGVKEFVSKSMGTYKLVHRRWPDKARKALIWLMGAEIAGVVPCLVIFGLAQPDLYRTAMWQIGWDNRLNSNPNIILFAYANHTPQPTLPLIWSRTLTDFNVAISVISLFFMLAKVIGVIMKFWHPIISTFINVAMVALYTVSVYGQIGPDYLDPRYPAPVVWYFRYGCKLAEPRNQVQNCHMAQGSLFVTLYMLVVYLIYLGFSIWAMWPNPINDIDDDDEVDSVREAKSMNSHDLDLELKGMGVETSAVPFTPRTQAFYTLDRKLPLRQPEPMMSGSR